MTMKFFLFLLLFAGWPSLALAQAEEMPPLTVDTPSSIMEKARKNAREMTLPKNKHAEKGQMAAQHTADIFHSPEFQKQLDREQQRMKEKILKNYGRPWEKQAQEHMQERPGIITAGEKIYLFFSSSLPDEIIRQYLAAIAVIGDSQVIPVVRGFVKGLADIQASIEFFNEVVKEDPNCRDEMSPQKICRRFPVVIKVNPLLFSQYGITRVPAVVYANTTDAFAIQGDAGLDYLLERINREAKNPQLAKLISTLRDTP